MRKDLWPGGWAGWLDRHEYECGFILYKYRNRISPSLIPDINSFGFVLMEGQADAPPDHACGPDCPCWKVQERV